MDNQIIRFALKKGKIMEVKWRKIVDEQPEDGQKCLTDMKHGVISGFYSAKERTFTGYYFNDIEWYAYRWIPFEELNKE